MAAPRCAPTGESSVRVTILRTELARVQAERDGLAARLADRHRELEQAHADRQALHSLLERRDREVERMQVLLQAEQQQVKALTDQRQQVPWWRRWVRR